MILTTELIQECQERERAWCAMSRTRAEERQTVALLESMEPNRIVIPNWHVPADVQVLIESVTSGAPVPTAGSPPHVLSEYRQAPTPPSESQDDGHARLVHAVRSPETRPARVLTEDRGHERDLSTLTETERYLMYARLASGDDSIPLPRLRSRLAEHREAERDIPADAHRRLAEAIRGAEPALPAGIHERMARAFGR